MTKGSGTNQFLAEITPDDGYYLSELYCIYSDDERYEYDLSGEGYHGGTRTLTLNKDGTLYAVFAPLKDPVEIRTEEEFRAFRDAVNNGTETFAGGRVMLTTDLDLAGEEWLCIGTRAHKFHGDFDGQGHVIRGLNAVENT